MPLRKPLMQPNELRFLADECIWRSVVVAIREAGFDCDWVQDVAPGITDREVLELSVAGKLLLITEDGDFGDLVFREHLGAFGVIRVRLSSFEGAKEEVAAIVASRIAKVRRGLIGNFTTIEPKGTRSRALPVRLDAKD